MFFSFCLLPLGVTNALITLFYQLLTLYCKMDSITQIVLGASVAEAVGGKKLGGKAALWGAIAGTIPDLDVLLLNLYHPIDAALMHRGFSHSILFALTSAPILAWIVFNIYKKRYDLRTWGILFFLSIVTHPILDMFTNYGTQFLWPLKARITFNTIFVIDPLYTLPFSICLLIALLLKRQSSWRKRWNWAGIIYSSTYLVWGVLLKINLQHQVPDYFKEAHIKPLNTMITPMPLTSFYWMILTETDSCYYLGYKSIFYPFQTSEIEKITKNHSILDSVKWKGQNYTPKLKYISTDFYRIRNAHDTLFFDDLRFGLTTQITNKMSHNAVMGFGMVIDNGIVQKTFRSTPSSDFKNLNLAAYYEKIFYHE
jgi:inner membrane protein